MQKLFFIKKYNYSIYIFYAINHFYIILNNDKLVEILDSTTPLNKNNL